MGRSILATGNGRCNFSNAQVDAGMYRNASFVGKVLEALAADSAREAADVGEDGFAAALGCAADPVHAFFADLAGLCGARRGRGGSIRLRTRRRACSTCCVRRLRAKGCDVECEHRATRIDAPERAGDRWHVRFADGAIAHARAVIVTTGGRTARDLVPGALPFAAQRPCSVRCAPTDGPGQALNNIRVRCTAALADPDGAPRAAEAGEVLFRDYGVSGIAVFNLSRFARPGDALLLDLLPQFDARACEQNLRNRRARLGAPTGEGLLVGMFVSRWRAPCSSRRGCGPMRPLRTAMRLRLPARSMDSRLPVRGVGDARQCQVTRGGFAVAAFDARTLEARELPGLFAAGEALDVDAPCGGYNLHWAWASGIVAGRAAAAALAKRKEKGTGRA